MNSEGIMGRDGRSLHSSWWHLFFEATNCSARGLRSGGDLIGQFPLESTLLEAAVPWIQAGAEDAALYLKKEGKD